MTRTETEARSIAFDIINNRRSDIEDRADVKWYMEETDIPEYLEVAVWTIVCTELGI